MDSQTPIKDMAEPGKTKSDGAAAAAVSEPSKADIDRSKREAMSLKPTVESREVFSVEGLEGSVKAMRFRDSVEKGLGKKGWVERVLDSGALSKEESDAISRTRVSRTAVGGLGQGSESQERTLVIFADDKAAEILQQMKELSATSVCPAGYDEPGLKVSEKVAKDLVLRITESFISPQLKEYLELFHYDGFDPKVTRDLFFSRGLSIPHNPKEIVEDLKMILSYYATRGVSILRKGVSASKEDAKVVVISLVQQYAIVEKIPNNASKENILTVGRISAAFPKETYVTFREAFPPSGAAVRIPKCIQFPAFASLIPTDPKYDAFFEDFVDWLVEFDRTINVKVRAAKKERFDPLESRKRALNIAKTARSSEYVHPDAKASIVNAVPYVVSERSQQLVTEAAKKGISVLDLLIETAEEIQKEKQAPASKRK